MKLKVLLFATLAVICSGGALQAQDSTHEVHRFSMEDCIAYAKKNNVQIKNALLDYQLQVQSNKAITAQALPSINGSANMQYNPNVTVQSFPNFIAAATYGVLEQEGVKNGSGDPIVSPTDFGLVQAAFGTKWTSSVGVSFSQIIFDGQVFVGLQARRTSLLWQNKNTEITEEAIKLNVYKIYYQLAVSKTQIDQLDANIGRSEKLLNDTKALYTNGFAEKLDVDKATVQLTNLQTQKRRTINSISNGYLGLKFLIGMPVRDSLVLTDSVTENSIKDGLLNEGDYNYTDRKEYQYLDLSKKLNEYNVRRYQLSKLPTLRLNANYSKLAQRTEFNFFNTGKPWFSSSYIGVSLDVPLFSGFAKNAEVQQAKLQLQQVNNNIENLKRQIDYQVDSSVNSYHNAVIELDYQRKNMQLAEQVYNQTKTKYESGLASTTDISNAEADLRTAQDTYVTALYEAAVAKVDYMKAIGKLE